MKKIILPAICLMIFFPRSSFSQNTNSKNDIEKEVRKLDSLYELLPISINTTKLLPKKDSISNN
ncbi:MAG: hypothetical protein ABIP35_11620 [Ginsengibacter sp.]